MTSAVPRPSRPWQQLRNTHQPVAITCLQWDCDGALNDDDREWMLQRLAAQDPLGMVLLPLVRSQRI